MEDPLTVENARAGTGVLGPLKEARMLQARIRGLTALLRIQQQQIERLNDRLYEETPGGIAARRLLDLKRSGKG